MWVPFRGVTNVCDFPICVIVKCECLSHMGDGSKQGNCPVDLSTEKVNDSK